MKKKQVIIIAIVTVVCLAVVVGVGIFFSRREEEKQETPPVGSTMDPTLAPSFTAEPTPTPNLEAGVSDEELLSALQQGVFGSYYEVLHYEEQVGELYNYATFVCRVNLFGYAEFVKLVGLFEKENGSLEELIYIDSDGGFTLYNLGENYIPIKETDVNFDGKTDVLIFKGDHSGAYSFYTCYLGTDDGIVYCPKYEEIADPVVHTEKQIIQTRIQNHAGSRTGVVYQYIDGEFTKVERLTWTNNRQDENGNWYNEWTLERLVDGEFAVIEILSDKGMTEKEKLALREKIESLDTYAPIAYDGYWD